MRLNLRINKANAMHTNLSMWVNGGLVTGKCGITLRNGELLDFILQLNPDEVVVDRDNISSRIFSRLEGLQQVVYI